MAVAARTVEENRFVDKVAPQRVKAIEGFRKVQQASFTLLCGWAASRGSLQADQVPYTARSLSPSDKTQRNAPYRTVADRFFGGRQRDLQHAPQANVSLRWRRR